MKKNRFLYSTKLRILCTILGLLCAIMLGVCGIVILVKDYYFQGEDISKINSFQETRNVKSMVNEAVTVALNTRTRMDNFDAINKLTPRVTIYDFETKEYDSNSIYAVEKKNEDTMLNMAINLIDNQFYINDSGENRDVYEFGNYSYYDFRGETEWLRITSEQYEELVKKYTVRNTQTLNKVPEGIDVYNPNQEFETTEVIEEDDNKASESDSVIEEAAGNDEELDILTEDSTEFTVDVTGEEEIIIGGSDASFKIDPSIINVFDTNINKSSIVVDNGNGTYDCTINNKFGSDAHILQYKDRTFLISENEGVIYNDYYGWNSVEYIYGEVLYVPSSYIDYETQESIEISILLAPFLDGITPVLFDSLDDGTYTDILNVVYANYGNGYMPESYFCYENVTDGMSDKLFTNADLYLDVDINSYEDCKNEIIKNSDVVIIHDHLDSGKIICYYEKTNGDKVYFDYLSKTNRRIIEEQGQKFNLVLGLNIEKDPFNSNYYWSSTIFTLTKIFSATVPIFVIAFIVFILCVFVLTFNTGYLNTTEGAKLRLVGFDKLPMEILALMFIAGAGMIYAMLMVLMDYSNYYVDAKRDSDYVLILFGFTGCIVVYFIFEEIYLSIVRRIKCRKFWDSIFVVRLVRYLGKKINELEVKKFNTGALVIKILITVAIYIIGAVTVLYAWRIWAEEEFAVVIVIALGLFSIYIVYRLIKYCTGVNKIIYTTEQISSGDFESKVETDKLSGNCQQLGENINSIGDGLAKAVDISTRDERMKAELITNVSHDIKTPLTSIINYVGLIKRENVENEKVKDYINVLDKKSQRLKQLIEDLVEASKASTGNLTLECTNLDFKELLQQTIGEFSDKFLDRNLELVDDITTESCIIYADGRRCFRIVENLFQNAYKYSMPGTRVYLKVSCNNLECKMTMKNISEAQLNISPEELTERFVRGDESRTTEGSGLGLSIAKDLAVLQNGRFDIDIDGDMFKVMVTFPLAKKEEAQEN